MKTMILLNKFMGNGVCQCELIEVENDCILNHGWLVMDNKEIGLTIKRRDRLNLKWSVQSVNLAYHVESIEKAFECKVLKYSI